MVLVAAVMEVEGAVEMKVEDGWWLPWLRRDGGRKTSFHGG